MPALGTEKNPIILGCSCVNSSDYEIGECVIREIQRKFGLNNKIFTNRNGYLHIIIEKGNCNTCPKGRNICKVETVVIPREVVAEYAHKIAVAV